LKTPVRLIAMMSSQSLITASAAPSNAVAAGDAGIVDQN